MFLVANKHPKTSHRIFCPVQFSIKFFRPGQKIPDFSSMNDLESLDFRAFHTKMVEPVSYPNVIPLSYLLDGLVWRQVCNWIGITTSFAYCKSAIFIMELYNMGLINWEIYIIQPGNLHPENLQHRNMQLFNPEIQNPKMCNLRIFIPEL